MIALASQDYAVTIDEDPRSEFYDSYARASRAANLDGSSTVSHLGVTASDMSFSIKAKITEAQETTLRNIHENSTTIWFSCRLGFFAGIIRRLYMKNGELRMTFWPSSQIV